MLVPCLAFPTSVNSIDKLECVSHLNDTTQKCTMTLSFRPIDGDCLGETLYAQVLVLDKRSDLAPIAEIVEAPILFGREIALETGSRSLELRGRFFSREPSLNKITFYAPNGVCHILCTYMHMTYSYCSCVASSLFAKKQVAVMGSVAGVDSTGTALTVSLEPPARPPNLGKLNATVELYGATSAYVQVASIVLADVDSTSTLICSGTSFSPLPVVYGDPVSCVIYIQGNGDKRSGVVDDFSILVQDHQGNLHLPNLPAGLPASPPILFHHSNDVIGPGKLGEITVTKLSVDETEIRFTYQSPSPSSSSSSASPSSESIVVRSAKDSSNILGSPVVIEFVAGRRSGLSFWEQNRDWIIGIYHTLQTVSHLNNPHS
jgi:hypothetical protein